MTQAVKRLSRYDITVELVKENIPEKVDEG